MNTFIRFLVLIFALFLSACQTSEKKEEPSSLKDKKQENTSTQKGEILYPDAVAGIIYTSGLSKTEKESLGLGKNDNFQIITEDHSFFIKDNYSEIGKMLGKCINLKGKLLDIETSSHKSGIFLGRVIEDNGNKGCSFGAQLSKEEMTQKIKKEYGGNIPMAIHEGVIVRNTRPAPDIYYDYLFKLNQPILQENDPRGDGFTTDALVVLPLNEKMRMDFESHLDDNKKINISGFMIGGYAESTVFQALEIR